MGIGAPWRTLDARTQSSHRGPAAHSAARCYRKGRRARICTSCIPPWAYGQRRSLRLQVAGRGGPVAGTADHASSGKFYRAPD